MTFDPWSTAMWLYLGAAIATLLPTLHALWVGVRLKPGGESFESAMGFSPEGRAKLSAHYSRLAGTLAFWKSRAAIYTRFHYYCICWTILSAWAVPLISATAPQEVGSPS